MLQKIGGVFNKKNIVLFKRNFGKNFGYSSRLNKLVLEFHYKKSLDRFRGFFCNGAKYSYFL